MSHSVRRHLSVEIDAYDETIRRFIPGYDEMVEAAIDAVSAIEPGLVLDLGAGTGALSRALLARGEVKQVELLDIDPEMLEKAKDRLAPWGWHARFRRRSFDDDLPSCDAVMASLSLHHVPELADKAKLYGRIHDALWGGGVLVNADVALPDGNDDREGAWRAWADHQVAHGIAEDQAWANFEAWAEEDTYFTLDEERTALESAGFVFDVAWRKGPMAVLVGRKAG